MHYLFNTAGLVCRVYIFSVFRKQFEDLPKTKKQKTKQKQQQKQKTAYFCKCRERNHH